MTEMKKRRFFNKRGLRLKSIELWDFRNIGYGKVEFCNANYNSMKNGESSLTGLYGQNGSGKTSVIIAMELFKDIVNGDRTDLPKYKNCIMVGKNRCKVCYEFSLSYAEGYMNKEICAEKYYLYSFELVLHDEHLLVNNEEIKIKSTGMDAENPALHIVFASGDITDSKNRTLIRCFKKAYTNLFDETYELIQSSKALTLKNGGSILFTKFRCEEHQKNVSEILGLQMEGDWFVSLATALACYPQYVCHYRNIDSWNDWYLDFNASNKLSHEEIIKNDEDFITFLNDFTESQGTNSYSEEMETICMDFRSIASSIFVVNTTNISESISKDKLPLYVSGMEIYDFDNFDVPMACDVMHVDLGVNSERKMTYAHWDVLNQSINKMNRLLSSIIPGMLVSAEMSNNKQKEKYDEFQENLSCCCGERSTLINNNTKWEKYEKIEYTVYSQRNGNKIPLQYESDGVKRLVSLTSLLIVAYNCPDAIVTIDELDACIFEFILGEIVSILAESARGQFIFTCHNMRPLEVLKPKNIYFTTTNPEKRFIKLTTLSGNNNLRDCYYRNIILGGNEPLCEQTDRFEMELAFQQQADENNEFYEEYDDDED